MREKMAILPSLYDFGGSMDEKNKWYVQYSVRDPRTGMMHRKKVYGNLHRIKHKVSRYKEADAIIEKYTTLLKSGWNPYLDDGKNIYTDQLQYKHAAKVYADKKTGNKTINFFINDYLKNRLSGLDPNTISTYTSKYRIFQQWIQRERLDDKDITAFSKEVICSFFTYLNNERKSSHVTYKKYKQLIYGLFDYIEDQGKILYNPVQKLPKCTRVVNMEPQPINDSDSIKFMERIMQHQSMYLFVLFEYYCLMRPNEIRMMQIKWIDFVRGIIRVPPEISKTRKGKTPIIPDVFMVILKEKYALHLIGNREFYVIGKFDEPGTIHLGKNTMRNRFNAIRKELKMPFDYKLYSWKHTANIRLEDIGVSAIDRMHQNGHLSIHATEKYTRNKSGFKSEAIRKVYPEIMPT